jgi:hypothetical protein
MKTSIVSAINNIAQGFAASYSNALSTMRGFNAAGQESDAIKPMVNTVVSAAVIEATAAAPDLSDDLGPKSLNITA